MTLREWMSQEDGVLFVRIPLDPKNALLLSSSAAEFPDHRLEIRKPFLGMFKND